MSRNTDSVPLFGVKTFGFCLLSFAALLWDKGLFIMGSRHKNFEDPIISSNIYELPPTFFHFVQESEKRKSPIIHMLSVILNCKLCWKGWMDRNNIK